MNNRNRSFIIVLSLLCGVNAFSLRINKPDRITSTGNPKEKWIGNKSVPPSSTFLMLPPSKLTQEVSNGSSDTSDHVPRNRSTKNLSSSSKSPSLNGSTKNPSSTKSPSSSSKTPLLRSSSPAPSISSAPSLSLCKTSADWTSVLVFYGSTPDCRLPECAGHCNSDSDCDSGLFCFQVIMGGINNSVPGCETVPYDNTNYCIAKELKPSSVPSRSPSSQPSMLPTTSSAPSRSPSSQPSVLPTTSSAPSLSPTREPSFPPTLTMTPTECRPEWNQLGDAIDTPDDYFAMSKDRLVVAVGKDNLVNVYEFDDNSISWIQIAEPIDPQMSSYYGYGYSLSISSDGSVVAIGDTQYIVKIFAVHPDEGWTQLGQDIYGETTQDGSGRSIELSADGVTIAVGAPHNDGNGTSAGHVRVYKYDTRAYSWVQLGGGIDGEAAYDYSGWAVSISRDGSNVAIGAHGNDDNGDRSGHVRVYKYDNDASKWIQQGGDIDGEAADDWSGLSVAMSGDGSTVAIGAPHNDGNGDESGHVRVYRFIDTNNDWVQRGDDIDGEAARDRSGQSVDISDDGTTIVIGALYNDGSARSAGQVRVYQYDTKNDKWIQKGADLDGDAENDGLGNDVSISSDGTVVGATGYYATDLKVWKSTPCTTPPTSMPSVAHNCADEQHTLGFDITTDRFPHQTTWTVKNLKDETVLSGGPYAKMFTFHSETNCLDKGCYRYTIQDSSSDGLCCDWFTGNGKYELFLDSVLIKEGGNFTSEESSIQFGIECPSYAPSISSSPSTSISPTEQKPPCPPGTFVNKTETDFESRCHPCPTGSYQNKETRSATCIKCKEGSYQEEKGQKSCNLCQPGTYQMDKGKQTCESCPRGTFQVADGQTECNECRVGGYCDTSLSGTCDGGFKPCGAGTYNNLKGQYNESSCLPCPAGKYADNDGFSECLPCPYRLGSTPNGASCPFCAKGFYLIDPQANTSEILQTPDDLCMTCPDNAICPGNTTLHTLQIKPTFWRDSPNTATVYKCKEGVCIGSNATSSNSDTEVCKDGHSGPLCEVCEEGKYLRETSGECSACPTSMRLTITILVIIAIFVSIIVGYVVIVSSTKGKKFALSLSNKISCLSLQAKVKIVLSFYQVFNGMNSIYGVRMDDRFKAWFNFMNLFNFRLLNYVMPKDCFGSLKLQIILSSLWPFILLAILILGLILRATIPKKIKGQFIEKMLSQSMHFTIIVVYVLLPSVSNSIFDAIRCKSFVTNDNNTIESSYLSEDLSIRCNENDKSYTDLLATFWILFTVWPVTMPLLFAGLLYCIRKTVKSDRITDLSEACRFLWRDYDKEMMFWEVLDIARKISLTGLIMFVDKKQGSERLLRLIIGIVLSTIYLGLLALGRPYKRNSDLYLSFISNILLIGCFLTGIIIHVCSKGDDSCERFIGQFTHYQATYFSVILTAGMLVLSILMITFLARTTIPHPTILVASTSSRPNLEMSEDCHFHLFLSHVWETGQHKAHSIVRMLQLHCPGVRIWLDVDQLEKVGGLEDAVEDSEVFVLYYSKGYFKSKNCCREVFKAMSLVKPTLVLYEGDESTIEMLKIEVRECFPQVRDSNDILSHILKESPILWLGGSTQPFAIASVKLVVLRLLQKLPYYRNRSAELNEGLQLQLGERLDPSRFRYPKKIFYCSDNEGAKRRIIDDLREKITGDVVFSNDETLIKSPVLDIKNEVLLLYLNDDIFHDTDGRVSVLVEQSIQGGRKILLISEDDANMGKCEFKYYMSQTPQALLDLGIYGDIALPLHTTPEYREVSLHLLQKKLSKISSPEEKEQSPYTIRSAMKCCMEKSKEAFSW